MALKAIHDRTGPVRGSGPPAAGTSPAPPGSTAPSNRPDRRKVSSTGESHQDRGRGQQILGLGVHPIDGQHLLRQRRRGHPITSIDRRHRPIEQLIDRRRRTPDRHRRFPSGAPERRSPQHRRIPRSTVSHNSRDLELPLAPCPLPAGRGRAVPYGRPRHPNVARSVYVSRSRGSGQESRCVA